MKLFFAGSITSTEQEISCHEAGIEHRLMSYADKDTWAKHVFGYWTGKDAPGQFFLDSGAYGAMTRGITIDLAAYCDYIAADEYRFAPYACLDVIGDWRGSAKNYDLMRERGLNPMPTFHLGSPLEELTRLLKETDYIAFGGLVGSSQSVMRPWLDKCWRIVKDHWPKKTHAFGVMAQWALERYPFYSTDSSSAILSAGMGRVSSWEDAKIVSRDWVDYARKYYDGLAMDRVSALSADSAVGTAHRGRSFLNIQAQLKLQTHITDVWRMRGITWEN